MAVGFGVGAGVVGLAVTEGTVAECVEEAAWEGTAEDVVADEVCNAVWLLEFAP